ncbi:MAG: hypothetical protein V3R83_09710 [Gammaproteobacteria bacterium]
MPKPRVVKVKHVRGRSVGYSFGGRMVRLRKGDEGEIQFELYERFRHRLERLDGPDADEPTALPSAVERLGAARASDKQMKRGAAESKEVPFWPLRMPPEKYIEIYGDEPDNSKAVRDKLELARRILA